MKLYFGHRELSYDHVMFSSKQGGHYFKDMWRFTVKIKEIPGHCTWYRFTSPCTHAKRLK